MDSPYFDSTYFDGAYFDVDVAPSGGEGRSGKTSKRRRPQVIRKREPERENEDWITLI